MLNFIKPPTCFGPRVGPSSGSMSSLAKVTLCTINMYTYVSDVGAFL